MSTSIHNTGLQDHNSDDGLNAQHDSRNHDGDAENECKRDDPNVQVHPHDNWDTEAGDGSISDQPGVHDHTPQSPAPLQNHEDSQSPAPLQNHEDSDFQRAILDSLETDPSSKSFEQDLRQALEASLEDSEAQQRLAEEEEQQLLQQLEASTQQICPICEKPMVNPSTTPCRHTFCQECLERWSEWSDSCPFCGKRCLDEDIYGS